MRPSEVLEQAHAETMRIRRELSHIDDVRRELRERIGVQGHGYERAPKNDIRDPMRHVCEAMDGEGELDDREREMRFALSEAARDAAMIVRGIRAYDQERSVVTGTERMLRLYCVEGESMDDVARMMCIDSRRCRRAYRRVLDHCDDIGMARLMAAARLEPVTLFSLPATE